MHLKFENIKITFIIAIFTIFSFSVTAKEIPHEEVTPLILISIDGFRYDYVEKYEPPNLLQMIKNGVRAERMIPSYPSKTFPNHITIVTGMYPSNHGIVHNSFYDKELDDVYKMGKAFFEPKWIQGTPLWIHAEKNGVKSASYFWPESDSTLQNTSASYSFKYNKQTPYQNRISKIIDWLKLPAIERPQFITSYFSLVDDKGHRFGPDSSQVKDAVLEVDRHIGILRERIAKELEFEVDIVLVSDHGMIKTGDENKIYWPKLYNFDTYKVINGTTQLMLYATNKTSKEEMSILVKALNSNSNGNFQAYLKNNLPKNLNHFNNQRIADIIIEARAPSVFSSKEKHSSLLNGMHGYNPFDVPEMGAMFIADGPSFKSGLTIPAFENIHVFPLLNHLLDLPMPTNIDGKLDVLRPIIDDAAW